MIRPYSSYKDSGIEWIGEIPSDWEIKPLKYCFSFQVGWTPPTGESENFIGDNKWATIADLRQKTIYETEKNISNDAVSRSRIKINPGGTLFYSFKLSVGKVAFAGCEMYTNEAIFSILPNNRDVLEYYYYLLPVVLSSYGRENIYGANLLNQELIKNASIIFPTKSVQEVIAGYLDLKTAQIDDLITKKEQMIEFLKEERTAIINQAVTKGLPLTCMFDTNAFDRLLEEDTAQFYAKIFITHIQKDQIEAIPQAKIEKKKRLLDIINIIDADHIPTSVAVWDVSKFDECCFGSIGNNELFQKFSKTNGAQDALIAVTAIDRSLILVTDDKDLLRDINAEGGRAITFDEFKRGITTELKDSGIEWLGKVPKHWDVVPLTKYLESIADYRGKTPEKNEIGGVFLVTARNIKGGKVGYSLSQEFVDLNEYAMIMSRGLPKIGDVLLTMEAPLGEVANVDKEEIALAQRVIKLRGKKNIVDNYFLKYWMMSASFQNHLLSLATGSTALGLKASKLNLLRLAMPPFIEQIEIVTSIENQSLKIEKTIEKCLQEIKLLQEYRTALISEVVTGKIDVRN